MIRRPATQAAGQHKKDSSSSKPQFPPPKARPPAARSQLPLPHFQAASPPRLFPSHPRPPAPLASYTRGCLRSLPLQAAISRVAAAARLQAAAGG